MFVYVISAGERRHKIGVATDPKSRLSTLQTGSPDELRIVHLFETDAAYEVESRAHSYLKDQRIRGEWFEATENTAISMVGKAVANGGPFDQEFEQFGGWTHTIGDAVECRTSREEWLRGPLPVVGRLYTVCCVYPEGQVDVAEVINDDIAFCPSMFWPAHGRRFA
jgi:hypothetical protein